MPQLNRTAGPVTPRRRFPRLLGRWYRQLLAATSGRLYCFLFNRKQCLLGNPGRIEYDRQRQRYLANRGRHPVHFCEKGRAGFYARGTAYRANTLATQYMLDRIEFNRGDLVVDCGANIGELGLYFDIRGIEVEYIAVEPGQREFDCLASNHPARELHRLGLWHENGVQRLFLSSGKADSSIIEPPHWDEIVDIQVRRLDDLVQRPIRLLKLEAEGAEPEVLAGCTGVLDQVAYISADLGPERGKAQATTLEPVQAILAEQGFELLETGEDRLVALFRNTALA